MKLQRSVEYYLQKHGLNHAPCRLDAVLIEGDGQPEWIQKLQVNLADNITRTRFRAFCESIRAKQEAEKVLVEPTVQAAELMLQCLMNDGKILACGNGGSAADAQHFAAEMTGRFEKNAWNWPLSR